MTSLSMDEFKRVLHMGLDRRGRRFATEAGGTARFLSTKTDSRFTVAGHPVNIKYVLDVLDNIGIEAFLKANPWAGKIGDYIKPLRTPAMDAADKAIKAHRAAEDRWIDGIIEDCKFMGWDSRQISDYIVGIAKRVRRRIAEDTHTVSGRITIPIDPAAILSNMFKFGKKDKTTHYDKKPRTRHYDMKPRPQHYLKKKAVVATD